MTVLYFVSVASLIFRDLCNNIQMLEIIAIKYISVMITRFEQSIWKIFLI